MERKGLLDRIVTGPGGRPCIQGTRIDILIILDSLAEGATAQEIVADYPALQLGDVQAAVAFAAELARDEVILRATG